ncbi:restriction endonuclease [Amycolatopsis sp. WGS_07]|uniref:restriction endonuclease n=1 Tax=Amycolatopsis sp. WGS_07 TaxID=3076764 RepID=UPI0038738704
MATPANHSPACLFDTDEIINRGWLYQAELDEILAEITTWDDDEVRDLLRALLMNATTLGIDAVRLEHQISRLDADKLQTGQSGEYWRRLLDYDLMNTYRVEHIRKTGTDVPWTISHPWEGITWILDLLNTSPREALRVISAYIEGHLNVLPDGRLNSLWDAATLIRAYYIGLPEKAHTRVALIADRTPRELEQLVAYLYHRIGYDVTLTRAVKDGGVDVLAIGSEHGRREKLCIQCTRSHNTVGIQKVRELGYVTSEHNATKGVLVTTSRFSPAARHEESRNSRLELLDGPQLVLLLNEHLDLDWPLNLERLLPPSVLSRS